MAYQIAQVDAFVLAFGFHIVEIVDYVTVCAGYDDCVHCVMAVVDALGGESSFQMERDIDSEETFAFFIAPFAETVVAVQLIKPLEAGCYYAVPYVIDTPLAFQHIGDFSAARYYVFRC